MNQPINALRSQTPSKTSSRSSSQHLDQPRMTVSFALTETSKVRIAPTVARAPSPLASVQSAPTVLGGRSKQAAPARNSRQHQQVHLLPSSLPNISRIEEDTSSEVYEASLWHPLEYFKQHRAPSAAASSAASSSEAPRTVHGTNASTSMYGFGSFKAPSTAPSLPAGRRGTISDYIDLVNPAPSSHTTSNVRLAPVETHDDRSISDHVQPFKINRPLKARESRAGTECSTNDGRTASETGRSRGTRESVVVRQNGTMRTAAW